MNTLTLIKKQIDKAAALHDAQINITKYRGVDCKVHEAPEETHGTFCYRGRTYIKWNYGSTTSNWDRIPFICSISYYSLRWDETSTKVGESITLQRGLRTLSFFVLK